MIVSINQPAYMPWLGYFHRIAMSDCHIVLDHVQFEKNSYINRNSIRTASGTTWLTVPVKTKGKFGELAINSLEINKDAKWWAKHWRSIQQNYHKAPFFKLHAPFIEAVYKREWRYLAELNREITLYLLNALGINTPLMYSSQMGPEGDKDELVLYLCEKVGANTYLSGALGRNYLREELFVRKKIDVIYQDYQHPSYSQCYGPTFEPYMASIDLLFNHGPASYDILMRGQKLNP
jgi:hypothetical protein